MSTRSASRIGLTLVVGALLGAPLCNPEPDAKGGSPAERPKKVLRLGTSAEPDVLNPLFAETAGAREIIFLMNRELTMHDDKWQLVPDLAVEIPTIENGLVQLIEPEPLAEGLPPPRTGPKMVVTWHIDPQAVWEDGTPVTAEDFLFAFEVQRDPTQEIINRDLVERIEKMEAKGPDKKTLVVTWKEPYAFYAQFRVHYALPKHALAARYYLPDGKTADLKKDPYSQRPLSNGPFKFDSALEGSSISLVKNERQVPEPKLDGVTYRFIKDDRALESALMAGDIDAVSPMGGFSVAQVEELKKDHPDRFHYVAVPGLVWAHVDFNLDADILQDVRVRQAITHAIDRQGLIDALFYGRYTVSHTFLPPRHWGYHRGVVTYEYDPQKANALLDEAGWVVPGSTKKEPKDPKGAVREKGNKRLSIKISAVAKVRDIENLEAVMQQQLAAIGVELIIDNKPHKAFFSEFGRKRKFEHLSFYSWVLDPTLYGNTMWQSDMIPSEDNNYKGQNYPGWVDLEATQLLKKIPTVLVLEKRKAMLHKVQELWAADLPAIPMYFRPVVGVASRRVVGYRPTGTRTPLSWNAEQWDLIER